MSGLDYVSYEKYYDEVIVPAGTYIASVLGITENGATPVYIDQTDRSSYFTSVNPDVATPQRFEANQTLMHIPAGITKVRVYMWLEGQDVDMENYVAASKLRYDLELAMLN